MIVQGNGKINIFQDWEVNQGNFKGRLVMCLFRLASYIRSVKVLSILFFWYLIFYRFFVEWLLNIELHWNASVGAGLRLDHGHSTVVNGGVTIGANCVIRHLTTIGNKKISHRRFSRSPQIGNNVDMGVNVTIIGDIVIGNNVVIGAGSVVTKSIPDNCVVVGNPARVLKTHYDYKRHAETI